MSGRADLVDLDVVVRRETERAQGIATPDRVGAPIEQPAQPTIHPVQSSNIASIGHDGAALFVAFKSGGTYRYDNVPVAVFDQLREAKSVGSFLHANIRGKYEGRKIEPKVDGHE